VGPLQTQAHVGLTAAGNKDNCTTVQHKWRCSPHHLGVYSPLLTDKGNKV